MCILEEKRLFKELKSIEKEAHKKMNKVSTKLQEEVNSIYSNIVDIIHENFDIILENAPERYRKIECRHSFDFNFNGVNVPIPYLIRIKKSDASNYIFLEYDNKRYILNGNVSAPCLKNYQHLSVINGDISTYSCDIIGLIVSNLDKINRDLIEDIKNATYYDISENINNMKVQLDNLSKLKAMLA